jgi:hypothetical protein
LSRHFTFSRYCNEIEQPVTCNSIKISRPKRFYGLYCPGTER